MPQSPGFLPTTISERLFQSGDVFLLPLLQTSEEMSLKLHSALLITPLLTSVGFVYSTFSIRQQVCLGSVTKQVRGKFPGPLTSDLMYL